jgi:serine/threonine protein kinase
MGKSNYDHYSYLGLQIGEYTLTELVGKGKIGLVFKAEKKNPEDVLACKIIPEGKLKAGWERELQKVLKLRGIDNVVQYHSHDSSHDKNSRPFTWIFWNFIDGINLRKYIETKPWQLDIAFIEDIAKTILSVLYSCKQVDIQHGDLHPGNILIAKADYRTFQGKPKIWVSDFGYGGSHNNITPKDDFKQLFSIITTLLHSLDSSSLNPIDRIMHQKMEAFFGKRFLEIDPTQGKHVGDLGRLIEEFQKIRVDAENEMAKASRGEQIKEPGDFLSAETLGFRVEEWRNLFVPEFLAAQDLLSKNITVLTGARGCGKTMAFRRLTAYMDKIIGENSGVPGSDQFSGFYLNCRDLIEAFPWIPHNINQSLAAQLIHYFHLAWFGEICRTLSVYEPALQDNYDWLENFLKKLYQTNYNSLPKGANVVNHILSFIETEKERCRLTDFSRRNESVHKWPLSRTDFLDELHAIIRDNVAWASDKPFYFFLDDYTIPIIPRNVQRILNPIIFKRRSNLFFKVSTESAISFERVTIRGKPLEIHQDFELIDLATESLYQDQKDKIELIEKIFKPRIERHEVLKNKDLTLGNLLSKTSHTSNELAWAIRNSSTTGPKKKIIYQGLDAFVGLWSSDIRIMIQMFVDILRESNSQIKKGQFEINVRIQDKVFRAAGGEFLAYAASVPNPSFLEKRQLASQRNTSFGNHLKEIVEAFIGVSKYELVYGKLMKNQEQVNPKQAFRLEIIDHFYLDESVQDFYDGLVRWHIFLQDWRGKSVRGMITPRLYLNRVLIPHSQLTFSSHDNIHLLNQELMRLLAEPKKFVEFWKKKKKNKHQDQVQIKFKMR